MVIMNLTIAAEIGSVSEPRVREAAADAAHVRSALSL